MILRIWLKLLFPSWGFFDAISQLTQIYFRHSETQRWQTWRPQDQIKADDKRRWINLFFNPRNNLKLYLATLIQTCSEMEKDEDLKSSICIQMLLEEQKNFNQLPPQVLVKSHDL